MARKQPEWEQYLRKLDTELLAVVRLRCDGLECCWKWERTRPDSMTFRLMTYVNGHFRGAWMRAGYAGPEQRVLRRHEHYLHKPAQRAALRKLPKSARAILGAAGEPDAKHVLYYPDWSSVTALVRHLRAEFQLIEIAEPVASAEAAEICRG